MALSGPALGTSKGGRIRFDIDFSHPELTSRDVGALLGGIVLWMNDHFDWYEEQFIKPLTSTWRSTHKPKFKRVFSTGSDLQGMWTTDSVPYIYLDAGTEKRLVRMRPGFAPKTATRKFKSVGPGTQPLIKGGRKVFFNRKQRRSRRKIRARKWTDEIAKRDTKKLAGRHTREKGQIGVLGSLLAGAIFVPRVDQNYVTRRLSGADFLSAKYLQGKEIISVVL